MRSIPVAYLLWFLVGPVGGHRFYCNRIGTGILYLFTGGLFLVGWIVDLFLIPGMVEQANYEARLRASVSPFPPLPPPDRVIYCTQCGGSLRVPSDSAGRQYACPHCRSVLIAPG